MDQDSDLVLVVNGRKWTGWTTARVSVGLERMPADFALEVTEKYPTESSDIDIKPGDPFQLMIGSDLVITGYIDRYGAEIDPSRHVVRITGRSKSEDLVDCSAEVSTGQISGTNALDLAQKLAAPHGIKVTSLSGNGAELSQFNIQLTESPWEIIERVARYSALLAYDTPDGNVVLAQVGATAAGGGFKQGVNVQSASVTLSMDQRFAKIIAVPFAVDSFGDIGSKLIDTSPHQEDPGVRSNRVKIIISEQIANGIQIAQARANWEVARRYGRSQAITVLTGTWRDSAGKLWTPNTTATVDIPALKISGVTWVIGEVTFSRDARGGTTAVILLMPKEAFQPAPELLYPFDSDIFRDTHPNDGALPPGQASSPSRTNDPTGGV